MIKKILTIAGSDCSGGAGVQADLKTFTVHQCYGMSIITALTAQNTQGVDDVFDITKTFIDSQFKSIFEDIFPDAIKIGMVSNLEIIESISKNLIKYNAKNIILDPVMVSTSGHSLLDNDAFLGLTTKLFPLASLITPNIPEAEKLLNRQIKSVDDMEKAANELYEKYLIPTLLKGGHNLNDANDVLCDSTGIKWFYGVKKDNKNTHGTGCTLSSAIACNLANGQTIEQSISNAKKYLSDILESKMNLGKGSGPLDHTYTKKIYN
ncbi:MAG: bifunctional hydroxymethylpyrimidine kinase/phosphomethylpyrimidine kinase [Mycoplasma sp.]